MARMTAADAAVAILQHEGVTHAFGRPRRGDQPLLRGDAPARADGIEHVLARHVEGASHMAEGYTRTTAGNIGVCIGTSGPAGTDMITGLYSASADSIPILCITGQAPVARLHKEDFQAVDIAVDRHAADEDGGHRARGRAGPGRLRAGLPPHALRPPRSRADRPAVRRADDRDRVRPRHLHAAAGLQAGGDPGAGREGARHAAGVDGAGDRRGRRDHQRRRLRAAGRAGRDPRRPGDPDADGLGRDPRRPPAHGRHGRAADRPPVRQRDDARVRLRARDRQPVGEPAHRRPRHLPPRPHLRPRRHRAHPDRARVRTRLRDRLRRRRRAGPVRRGREGAPRAAARPQRLGRRVRQAQADDAAPHPLRRRPGQAAARVRGDEPRVRPRHPLRQHHRALADRRRPVPARVQAAALDQRRAGRPARLDAAGGARASASPTPTRRSSRYRATTTSSS